MSEQDTTAFRNLVNSYRDGINKLDGANANLDTQIASLRLQIRGLEQTKETNAIERHDKIRKLAGIRRLMRELEDADTARLRELEDQEFANGQ